MMTIATTTAKTTQGPGRKLMSKIEAALCPWLAIKILLAWNPLLHCSAGRST